MMPYIDDLKKRMMTIVPHRDPRKECVMVSGIGCVFVGQKANGDAAAYIRENCGRYNGSKFTRFTEAISRGLL